jgi:hypothetical protein
LRWRQAADWVAVWAVVTPGILLSGELNYFNLAGKTPRLLFARQSKFHIELSGAFGVFVDCE